MSFEKDGVNEWELLGSGHLSMPYVDCPFPVILTCSQYQKAPAIGEGFLNCILVNLGLKPLLL